PTVSRTSASQRVLRLRPLLFTLLPADYDITVKNPTAGIVRETNVFIVSIRRRGSYKNQFAAWAQLILRDDLQLPANPALFVRLGRSEIRPIALLLNVGRCPRYVHRRVALPCTCNQIAVCNQVFHEYTVMNRATFTQG